MPMNKKQRSVIGKEWSKPNKNHYPDSEWVWQQIENNIPSTIFADKLEKKYTLSQHGNVGKKNLGRKKTINK